MSPSWLVVLQRTVVCWGLKKVTWLRTWLVLRASVTLVWMLSSSGSALSCCHKLVWLLHLRDGGWGGERGVVGGYQTDAAGWGRTRISVSGQPPGVWSTTLHRRWPDSLEHAVAAVPLDGGGRDPLGHTRHQLLLPGEVVVRQVFNASENYRHRR